MVISVAMNQLGYDVWTWGNHEYNFDYKRRSHLIEQANATILSGNVHMKSTGERYLPAWTIIEREGVRIGIIGVNTPIGKLINADLCGHDEIKGISSVYTKGTGIINLLGHAGMYYTGAQCAILCTDYEDAGFPIGPISIKDISSAYSFSAGEITVYEMTGKQLKQLLEWSAGYFNTMKEGDLTISYNSSRMVNQ